MAYLKRGYPKQRASKDGVLDVWAYVGTISQMATLRPKIGAVWKGLEVYSAEVSPIDDEPGYAELVIECGSPDPRAASTQTTPNNPTTPTAPSDGDATSPITPATPPAVYTPPAVTPTTPTTPTEVVSEEFPYYEIDQVPFERALRTHPDFESLTVANWNAIEQWEKEPDSAARALFQYWERDSSGTVTGSVQTLSEDSKDYANLRLRGVEVFTDYAPVFRKTSRYTGNSAPATSDTGKKVSTPSGAPSGYEWVKSGDSARKQGNGSVWIRTEEWTGARKVLVDKDDIFVFAP